ncbi:MAG: DUF2695 domain-containing protein [Gammaproteobacteria bacterium]
MPDIATQRPHAPDASSGRRREETRPAPLSNELMLALFDHLEECLDVASCEHDLRHTEAFLVGQGRAPAPAVAWLRRLGAQCDCEILERLELTWSAEDEAPGPLSRAVRGGA